MNQPAENTPTPPPVPGYTEPKPLPPLEPMESKGLQHCIEGLLKGHGKISYEIRNDERSLWPRLLGLGLVCYLFYGFIVGCFAGGDQLWATPLKFGFGILFSALICLPSLYIFACLGEANVRLQEVLGLLYGLLALSGILLIGFAPVAWVFGTSTESVALMGLLHLGFWSVSIWFGIRFLGTAFQLFDSRRMQYLGLWAIIFVLVALQMSTTLRPLIGDSDTLLPQEKKFFLTHWLESSVEMD